MQPALFRYKRRQFRDQYSGEYIDQYMLLYEQSREEYKKTIDDARCLIPLRDFWRPYQISRHQPAEHAVNRRQKIIRKIHFIDEPHGHFKDAASCDLRPGHRRREKDIEKTAHDLNIDNHKINN